MLVCQLSFCRSATRIAEIMAPCKNGANVREGLGEEANFGVGVLVAEIYLA
jgi:hypothetical protein